MHKQNGYSVMGRVGVFVTLALNVAVIVLSFQSFSYVSLGLGLLTVLLGGLRFFVEAVRELRSRRFGQYFLGSLGLLVLTGVALAQSLVGLSTSWWQAASVASVLSVTHWYLRGVSARVNSASTNLLTLLPEYADVMADGSIEHVRASEVSVGDILLVRPEATVPVDGVVVQGESSVDESILTGEDLPVAKKQGSLVFAGTVNASAKRSNKALTIRATSLPGDFLVQNFTRKVEALALSRGMVDQVSAKLESSLFVLTLASAFIAGGLWLILEPAQWVAALSTLAAVLLAVNLAVVSSVSPLVSRLLAALAGVRGSLVRSRTALYRVRKSHIVVMNLVGTLTMGESKLVGIHLAKGTSLGSESEVLAVAAAMESKSSHVLAREITSVALARNIEFASLYELEHIRQGVSARMDGSSLLLGSAALLTANSVPIDVQDFIKVADANERGNSIVYLVIDNLLVAYLEFKDEVRETAREAVRELQVARKRVIAITGEAEGVAKAICESLGIVEYFAERDTAQKLALLDELRMDGSVITAVGSPTDDASLLASAEVGIALGVGADLGTESADILVISTEPRAVGRMMTLARASTRTVTLSLVFVGLFDVVAISLAGFLGQPILSAGFVLLSSVVSGVSILRLRRY